MNEKTINQIRNIIQNNTRIRFLKFNEEQDEWEFTTLEEIGRNLITDIHVRKYSIQSLPDIIEENPVNLDFQIRKIVNDSLFVTFYEKNPETKELEIIYIEDGLGEGINAEVIVEKDIIQKIKNAIVE